MTPAAIPRLPVLEGDGRGLFGLMRGEMYLIPCVKLSIVSKVRIALLFHRPAGVYVRRMAE